MGISFDGVAKLATLSPGTTSLDLADLWSRWKDWVRLGNAGYPLMFDTVGGEPIDPSAGTLVPLYLFQLNGWKIRPQEASHTLTVKGGTLLVEGGGDPFANTLGNYQVRIRYSQPVQAVGYSTTGGSAVSPAEIADAVAAHSTIATMAIRMAEAWGRLGLDPSKPLVTGQTEISFGDIVMAMAVAGSQVTVTRQ